MKTTTLSGNPCIANKPRRLSCNCRTGTDGGHWKDFHPLRLCDNHYHEHSPIKRTSEIHMSTLLGAGRPDPWIVHFQGCLTAVILTIWKSLSLFDIAIQICSPSLAPFLNGLGKVPTTLRAETWMVLLLCIVPRNKKPSSTVNFLRLARYYRSSSGVFSSAGQPCKTKCKTRERTASPLVASLILLAVMGVRLI